VRKVRKPCSRQARPAFTSPRRSHQPLALPSLALPEFTVTTSYAPLRLQHLHTRSGCMFLSAELPAVYGVLRASSLTCVCEPGTTPGYKYIKNPASRHLPAFHFVPHHRPLSPRLELPLSRQSTYFTHNLRQLLATSQPLIEQSQLVARSPPSDIHSSTTNLQPITTTQRRLFGHRCTSPS
jgi:hypothetical protein